MRTTIELWRTGPNALSELGVSDLLKDRSKPGRLHEPVIVEPDSLIQTTKNYIGWFHHNKKSVGFDLNNKLQGLSEYFDHDPILHRTFGAMITGSESIRVNDKTLQTTPAKTGKLNVYVLTKYPSSPDQWIKASEELMQPFFKMYAEEIFHLSRYRTKKYFGFEGAYFPEVLYFWGSVFSATYGWTPYEERQDKLQESGYHKWEWVAGPELVFMMLDYYDYTQDEEFLKGKIIPVATQVMKFFDNYYKTNEKGKPDIELGINALKHRWDEGDFGWRQDDLFMAYLGLTEQAKDNLVARSKNYDENSRFPAFWGPNYDWTPDQDHGGILMKTFQSMLMQTDPYSKKIYLCPAWPSAWDVAFKLHAPYNTTIEGEIKNGNLINLKVTPESREKDIIIKP